MSIMRNGNGRHIVVFAIPETCGTHNLLIWMGPGFRLELIAYSARYFRREAWGFWFHKYYRRAVRGVAGWEE